MKKIIVLLMSFITTACVTGYNPTYWFNEVQVVNLSGSAITDVKVRVVDTMKSYGCEEVAQFALCRDYFGKRQYPQQGIELSWTHPDGSSKSELLGASIPVYYNAAFPLRIVMEVLEDGSVKIFYEQEEPSGDGPMVISG
jgi:hypothetical protein